MIKMINTVIYLENISLQEDMETFGFKKHYSPFNGKLEGWEYYNAGVKVAEIIEIDEETESAKMVIAVENERNLDALIQILINLEMGKYIDRVSLFRKYNL